MERARQQRPFLVPASLSRRANNLLPLLALASLARRTNDRRQQPRERSGRTNNHASGAGAPTTARGERARQQPPSLSLASLARQLTSFESGAPTTTPSFVLA
jgi:hypothetical protein